MVRRALVCAVLAALSSPLLAADAPPKATTPWEQQTDMRLLRLERLVESRQLVEMVTRLDRLQRDIQEQRGSDEEQIHALQQQKQRLHEIYLDIDRRLSQLERGRTAQPGGAPTAGEDAGSGAGEPGGERESYQKAFDLLRELRYEQAIGAFEGFLQSYPQASYAPLAQYWIGEAHYASQSYEKAIEAYQKLISNYPDSPKRAEGMLKIGYSQHELKKSEEAVAIFEQIIADFPDGTEADQARAALKSLKQGERSE